MNGRKAYRLMPIMLLALFGAPSVQAEQCWSTGLAFSFFGANMSIAAAQDGFAGAAFNFAVSNCYSNVSNNLQATPFGPSPSNWPVSCVRTFVTEDSAAQTLNLRAYWANTAARIAAGSDHGCQFVCGNGTMQKTCQVRALDGLPVELMSFSVDDEETGE